MAAVDPAGAQGYWYQGEPYPGLKSSRDETQQGYWWQGLASPSLFVQTSTYDLGTVSIPLTLDAAATITGTLEIGALSIPLTFPFIVSMENIVDLGAVTIPGLILSPAVSALTLTGILASPSISLTFSSAVSSLNATYFLTPAIPVVALNIVTTGLGIKYDLGALTVPVGLNLTPTLNATHFMAIAIPLTLGVTGFLITTVAFQPTATILHTHETKASAHIVMPIALILRYYETKTGITLPQIAGSVNP